MAYESQQFYDAESAVYSEKRYEGELRTYTQYIFRTRLKIFLDMLGKILNNEQLSLLEIGCADGVIIQKIMKFHSSEVKEISGLDISPRMVETARSIFKDPRVSFALRGEEGTRKYDIVLELGVHMENLEKEMDYVKSHLNSPGYFVCSVAGRNSLHARLKLKDAPYVKDYKTYEETEAILGNHFEIVEKKSYGLFVPKLWAVPAIARLFQLIIDTVFRYITPSLFHETIYLLRYK